MKYKFGDLRLEILKGGMVEIYQYAYNDQDRLAWVLLTIETNYNRTAEQISLWYNQLPSDGTDYMYYREKEGLNQ